MDLFHLRVWQQLKDALVCKHEVLMEQVSELTRLLYFKKDLARDIAIAHLSLLRLSIDCSDFFQAVQLHDCCLERTAQDNSGVGTLGEESVESVLFLIDASDIKEPLELDIGN